MAGLVNTIEGLVGDYGHLSARIRFTSRKCSGTTLCWLSVGRRHQLSDVRAPDQVRERPGKTRLGPASELAAAACRASEEISLESRSATTSGDVSKRRDFVQKWAAGHPITGTIAARQPILSIDITNELPNAMTVGQAAAEVANSLDDINRRLEVYSGQVVRQARWEVERQMLGVLEDLSAKEAIPLIGRAVASAERAAADISRLVPAVEGAAHTAERGAEIVATERQEAVSAISADLARTIDFAQRERLAVLENLTSSARRRSTIFARRSRRSTRPSSAIQNRSPIALSTAQWIGSNVWCLKWSGCCS